MQSDLRCGKVSCFYTLSDESVNKNNAGKRRGFFISPDKYHIWFSLHNIYYQKLHIFRQIRLSRLAKYSRIKKPAEIIDLSAYRTRSTLSLSKFKLNFYRALKTAAIAFCAFFFISLRTYGADPDDLARIGAAYLFNLALHEIGHQAAAAQIGVRDPNLHFFTVQNGQFFPGLSTYKSIPFASELPYAAAGFSMSNQVFNFGLAGYRDRPTTFNRALMVFAACDFLLYTAYANYIKPDAPLLDANQIRQQTGLSKSGLLGLAAINSLIQYYRIMHQPDKYDVQPVIETTRDSVFFGVRILF